MVNAQEWLNNNINQENREQANSLFISQKRHCDNRNYNCDYCYNRNTNTPQTFRFYNTLLEGERIGSQRFY